MLTEGNSKLWETERQKNQSKGIMRQRNRRMSCYKPTREQVSANDELFTKRLQVTNFSYFLFITYLLVFSVQSVELMNMYFMECQLKSAKIRYGFILIIIIATCAILCNHSINRPVKFYISLDLVVSAGDWILNGKKNMNAKGHILLLIINMT